MPDTLRSDNPIAERRYAYARAAASDGDWRTAAEVLEQALEIAPRWAAARFALGEALQHLRDFAGAEEKFAQCLRLDPADAQGAQLRLVALGAAQPEGLPAAYVARLFDDYAPRFNAHLVRELCYRGPELVAAALDAVAPERKFRRMLDMGCGSGLAGAALRARCKVLVGVDISPKMIVEAARTKLYNELRVGDFLAFLAGQLEGAADLVVAADVFVCVGDLAPAFAAIARAGERRPFGVHGRKRARRGFWARRDAALSPFPRPRRARARRGGAGPPAVARRLGAKRSRRARPRPHRGRLARKIAALSSPPNTKIAAMK